MKKFIITLMVLFTFIIGYSYPMTGNWAECILVDDYYLATDSSAGRSADTITDTIIKYTSTLPFTGFYTPAGENLLLTEHVYWNIIKVGSGMGDLIVNAKIKYNYTPLDTAWKTANLILDTMPTSDSLYRDTLTTDFRADLRFAYSIMFIYEMVMDFDSFQVDTYEVDSVSRYIRLGITGGE